MMDTLIVGAGRQPRLQVSSSGKFQLHDYGAGTFDETAEATTLTKQLGVDASGNVVSGTTGGGGSGLNYISAGAVATNLETTSNCIPCIVPLLISTFDLILFSLSRPPSASK